MYTDHVVCVAILSCVRLITIFHNIFIDPKNDDDFTESPTDDLDESDLDQIMPEAGRYLSPEYGHKVFVIQPDMKRLKKSNIFSVKEHQLEEACALVKCLPDWQVIGTAIEVIDSRKTKELFSRGKLENVKQLVKRNKQNVSAVFFSIDVLNSLQLQTLQRAFKLPVYDRFTVVMQIFKLQAQTREAKLQVALAEIPYYRSRMKGISFGQLHVQTDDSTVFSGTGSTPLETRQMLLGKREKKIMKELDKIKNNRELLRKGRLRSNLPVIAVVGYTNSGKTSLIKALTDDKKLEPQDRLFATLDVTNHAGLLSNRMKVLFVDTVGFIADIPTGLIASFSATLEDALNANVIIHVRDISHPDRDAQKHNVLETLTRLSLPPELYDSIIEVANKFDKLTEQEVNQCDFTDSIAVSATTGLGLQILTEKIERIVVTNTDRLMKTFRVPMSGEHLSWLHHSATVTGTRCCKKDTEFLLVDTILTERTYAKFLQQFGTPKKKSKTTDSNTR